MESGLNQGRLGKEIRSPRSIGMDKSAASKEKKSRSKMMIVRSKYYKRCKQLLIPEVTPTRCPDVWGF
jgi:hypothetical protein